MVAAVYRLQQPLRSDHLPAVLQVSIGRKKDEKETSQRASEGMTMSQAREMAHLTKELSRALEFRKSAIVAMREATKSGLATCAQMRGEMARDYLARMHKFISSLAMDVAAHRQAMALQVAQTQKFLSDKAKDVAAHRNATMNRIARFGSDRSKAAGNLRSGLEQQMDAIVTQTADAVSKFADGHHKMAKQQKAALKSGYDKLHKDSVAFVKAMHADRMKAQGIWSGLRSQVGVESQARQGGLGKRKSERN